MINENPENNLLLFIEPKVKEKLSEKVEDEFTEILERAVLEAIEGTLYNGAFKQNNRYKGIHTADDGSKSNNYDILLPNGLVTHTLCVHYLKWYRNSIPDSDFEKLKGLVRFYDTM